MLLPPLVMLSEGETAPATVETQLMPFEGSDAYVVVVVTKSMPSDSDDALELVVAMLGEDVWLIFVEMHGLLCCYC